MMATGGCGSFYSIIISSPKFNGLSTIKQHKLVNQCLKEDIEGIHGLQVCHVVRISCSRGECLSSRLETDDIIPVEDDSGGSMMRALLEIAT